MKIHSDRKSWDIVNPGEQSEAFNSLQKVMTRMTAAGNSHSQISCRTMTSRGVSVVPVDHNHPGAAEQKAGNNESHRSAGESSIAVLGGRPLQHNSGIPLDLNWVQEVRVNTSAVERRAQTQVARRTVKKEWQAAWLLRAITCMDLTSLSGDDTEERVRRLCAKARQPVQQDLVRVLQIEELDVKVAAV